MLFAMATDWKQEYWELKRKQEEDQEALVKQLVRDVAEIKTISQDTLDQAKRTNGRVNKLEKRTDNLEKDFIRVQTVLSKKIHLPPASSKFWVIMAIIALVLTLAIIGQSHLIERVLNVFA